MLHMLEYSYFKSLALQDKSVINIVLKLNSLAANRIIYDSVHVYYPHDFFGLNIGVPD